MPALAIRPDSLLNDSTWTNRDGEVEQVADMDPGRAARLLAWLDRRAEAYHEGMILTLEMSDNEHAFDSATTIALMTAAEWVQTTPLVRALRERAGV